MYLDFALSHRMGSFLRCMERCLHFFHGSTAVDVFDHMKTVVTGRSVRAPILHGRFIEYARVRGFAIFATRPRTPTDKPFVERGIGFVRTRFFPGRRFAGFEDLRIQGRMWRDSFANGREHEETGKVPALVYEHQERAALAPLRSTFFDVDDLETTGVGRMHRVHFDRNDSTVPWRLHGQTVLLRTDDDWVRVMLGPKEVARHRRGWSIREDIQNEHHEDGMHDRSAERRAAGALPDSLSALGEVGTR
jgi:hypothetical protein